MSISQKTYDVDIVAVETLFTRGWSLSTSQAYISIVEPIGTYIAPPTYINKVLAITSSLVANVDVFTYGVAIDKDNIYMTSVTNRMLYIINKLTSEVNTITGIGEPSGVTVDTDYIYITDTQHNVINMIDKLTYSITTLAGSTQGTKNAVGTNAQFYKPYGIAVDTHYVYVADSFNGMIRKINKLTSDVTTLAGSTHGYANGVGTSAQFMYPQGVAVDISGYIYVADTGNKKIRRIDPASNVTTVITSPYLEFYYPNATTISSINIYTTNSNTNTDINTLQYISTYEKIIVNCNVNQSPSCRCKTWSKPFPGQFLQWSQLPISTVYYNYFYGNDVNIMYSTLLFMEGVENGMSTSLQYNTDTISSFSNANTSTISSLMNIDSSTNSSFYSSFLIEQSLHMFTVFPDQNAISTLRPVSTTNIYNTPNIAYAGISTPYCADEFVINFPPYWSSMIELGNYYYLPRPLIITGEIPWYWQGIPQYNVEPGINTLYETSIDTYHSESMASFSNTLSNTSSSWGQFHSTFQVSCIDSFITYINDKIIYVDTGSSISSQFEHMNSTFISNLSGYYYGNAVSTFSTSITRYLSSYLSTIPTNGPYISTGASNMYIMNSSLNSTLRSHVSVGVLSIHLSSFSTIAVNTIAGLSTSVYNASGTTSLSTLNMDYLTYVKSQADALSVSTNLHSFECLSTSIIGIFSSFSTDLYTYFDIDLFKNLSTLNNQLSSFSTILGDMSTIIDMNSQYIVGPSVSTLNSTLITSTVMFQNKLSTVTAYYNSIGPIQDYSTNNATMYRVQASTLSGISSINVSTNGVTFLQGGVSIYQPIQKPSIQFPTFDIYDSGNPTNSRYSLLAQNSSIIFNNAFTIKRPGLIGINTRTPEYALDIGDGNARKLNGTMWINPSDHRIKNIIQDANQTTLFNKISSLRLVSYTWEDHYRSSHSLTDDIQLGFISQEVENVFPNSILHKSEEGYDDFRSLDTDQILKAKFGLTQQLLQKVSTLQSRINILYEY